MPRDPGDTETTVSFALWSLVGRKPPTRKTVPPLCSSSGCLGKSLLHIGFTSSVELNR